MPKRTMEQTLRDGLATASRDVATALGTVERSGIARDKAEARFQAAIKAHGDAEARRARVQRSLEELTGQNPPTAAEEPAPSEQPTEAPADVQATDEAPARRRPRAVA